MARPSHRRLSSITLLLFALFFNGNSAQASSYGCRVYPALTANRLVESKALGSGVTAQAWQWWPNNNDSSDAGLSPLGTKVSVVSADLRKVSFGITHAPIPTTLDLRELSYSANRAVATINGDYFDQNGPWNAMVENSQLSYATPGLSGVVGMASVQVNSAKGYRVSGTLKIGSKTYPVTGVNQINPGRESTVVYKSNFVNRITSAGAVTLVIRSGKIFRVYPKGANISVSAGVIVQVRGASAKALSKVALKTKVFFKLGAIPTYETRMSADTVTSAASISNRNTTLSIEAINFAQTVPTGATLFTDAFNDSTQAGRVTIRVLPELSGRLVVANVYRQGYFTRVDSGGYIVQANGAAATTALKFKAGDVVTISRAFSANNHSSYLSAAGRGPRLLENSKLVWVCQLHNQDFRPRSVIGWNQDGQIWLMTSSRGMDAADLGMREGGSTPDQMAHWLLSLGATDAVLLDGGGSTTMEIKDSDTNWHRFDIPDSAWYRPLANAFVIYAKN